jgi:DNA invertase Pin-like site-specific DNA recombinase
VRTGRKLLAPHRPPGQFQPAPCLRAKGVALRIVDLGINTSSATGELVLNLMGSMAQFERSMMLERQREGIAKAKAEGKYKGRKPTARRGRGSGLTAEIDR